MPDTRLIGPWIRRFLTEHIVGERNLSKNTQASYRDTLVLLLPFAQEKARKQIDKLLVDDLSPEVVRLFLCSRAPLTRYPAIFLLRIKVPACSEAINSSVALKRPDRSFGATMDAKASSLTEGSDGRVCPECIRSRISSWVAPEH
jgi:hypothetical protein